LFDLYETLITEHDPGWMPDVSVAGRLGVDERDFADAWARVWVRRMTGLLPDYPSALREICASLDRAPDAEAIARLNEERLATKARCFARIEVEVLEMLRALTGASLRLGLVSNASFDEVAAWEECPLAPLFDVVVFSYQVGLAKPDARIYHLACERLHVDPASALFVGDGGSQELTGAADAGTIPYWATWFLERWPSWKWASRVRQGAGGFPRLRAPCALMDLLLPGEA
jgi:putative hydrolase of the HAD superfamily